MTKEEINILAKWMYEVWQTYCKYMQVEMNEWDWDRLSEELERIWVASGRNKLILDVCVAYADDIERRDKEHASQLRDSEKIS